MNIQNKLIKFINRKIIKDKSVDLTPDTLIFDKGLVDSMNILYLIGFLEKHLNRRLTNQEVQMGNFKSVSAIIKTFFYDQQSQ